MWSGLLPPGLNESDVDSSSENEEESCISCLKEEDIKEDTERVQLPELQESGPESNAITKPVLISVADGENASETCPAGIPLNIWNKFLELQKKNREMKMEANQGSKGRKRKRRRKGVFFIFWFFSSQQLANEDHWKELTQYFGINDRFESPVDSRAPQKVIVVTKAVIILCIFLNGFPSRCHVSFTWIERFLDHSRACFLSWFYILLW
uniref:Protein FAM204A n=1 Tax=Pavo cristatus TaxID=9049 RepID=A0A8C9LDR6_PAVCR